MEPIHNTPNNIGKDQDGERNGGVRIVRILGTEQDLEKSVRIQS